MKKPAFSKLNFTEYDLMDKALDYQCNEDYSEAVNIYTHLIDKTGGNDYFLYSSRSLMYRYMGKFDHAINDIRKSIELNPQNPDMYWQFAALLSHYISLKHLDEQIKKIVIERGVTLLEQSLKIDPLTEPTWLDLIEKCILTGEYSEALGFIGESSQYVTSNHYCLIREWLASIALALAGKNQFKDFGRFFRNPECKLNGTLWSTIEIERYLIDLHKNGFDVKKLQKADEIHMQFLGQISNLVLYYKPYHNLLGIE